uniref:PDZ domain-containing protein n=1 Tax=Rubinisphaera brasiliensis (strain ATCC 49424 / DSM 5305 / JCM 21570 / IAM 15109 / NBRC 103401 / IFAM 1448) TaxID=756272 RepID=F0SMN5_RUBBR|nr:hypothetical protein Plabr_1241 [Rubinisphaera brasiliensis DSM 5305]
MTEATVEIEGEFQRESRGWMRSWKVWLIVLTILILLFVVGGPVLWLKWQWQIARSLESEHISFQGVRVLSRDLALRVHEWEEEYNYKLPIPKGPRAVECKSCTITSEMFEQLSKLSITWFKGTNIHFEPHDLTRFVEQSPELGLLYLIESDPVPHELIQEHVKDFSPHMIMSEATAFPGIKLVQWNDGLLVRSRSTTFSGLKLGDRLTRMNGESLRTPHQIREHLATLEAGDQLRFTVINSQKLEREEIYIHRPWVAVQPLF